MEFVKLIQCKGDNLNIIWKYPEVYFNTGTQLVVNELQEAVFCLNGELLDTFTTGKYILDANNVPLLIRRLYHEKKEKREAFHAEIYFVNLAEQMGVKWGTDNKVYFVDPCNDDYSFPIGARGEFSLKVNNAKKFLLKLSRVENDLNLSKLYEYFRSPIMMYIKSFLPKVLREDQVSIFDLDQHLTEYSRQIKQLLDFEMADYGLALEKFWITDILKPEDDPTYIELRKLRGRQSIISPESELRRKQALYDQEVELTRQRTEVEKERMMAMMRVENEKYRQQQLGYSYIEARQYDVMDRLATSGNWGKQDIENGIFQVKNEYVYCQNCGNKMRRTAKFCSECGAKQE